MTDKQLNKFNLVNEQEHEQLIINCLNKRKKEVLIIEGRKEFNIQDLFLLLLESTRFITEDIIINGKSVSSVYGFDYDKQAFVPMNFLLDKINTFIASKTKISDPRKTASQLEYLLTYARPSAYDIEQANFAPSYIVQYKNGWLNLKTKEFTMDRDVYKRYHFVKHLNYNYRNVKECNPAMLTICKRILSMWTNDEQDFDLYLKQIWFSMIEGNGRQKVHILKSNGGDGKSTFLRIGTHLGGGGNYFVRANMDEFADDNVINTINLSTSGVLGDDLSTNAKFGGKNMQRFKTMVSGEPFQASMKYHDNVIVQTNAVFVQATNSDLNFFENSPAIQDRLIVNNWVSKNFRRDPVSDYNLDKLSGGKNYPVDWEFIETMSALIMDSVTYFKNYTVPNRSKGLNEEMVQNSDQVYLFFSDLRNKGLLDFKIIPMNVLYKHFLFWLKENNAGSSPMSIRKFVSRVKQIMSQFKFTVETGSNNHDKQVRITSLETTSLDFNLKVFEQIAGYNSYVNKQDKTSYIINEGNRITADEISELEELIISVNKIPDDLYDDTKKQIILHHLTDVKQNVEIITLLTQ